MAPSRGRYWWEALAERAAEAFIDSRGAVLWSEVEAHLRELDRGRTRAGRLGGEL